MSDISVIIPALNEERHLASCLRSVAPLGAELIVADGGSYDRTCEIARQMGAQVVTSAAGRGAQLRAGAAAASGSVLFFLHADSRLTPQAPAVLASALADPGFTIGTFRLRLDSHHPLYRLYSWFTRFDSLWTSFGDQGIVLRRALYERIGGFPSWPILEDVALLRHARRMGRIRSLPAEIITSSRRFQQHGIVRQQLRNASILVRYLLGARPEDLAALYKANREALPLHATGALQSPLIGNGMQVDSKLCSDVTFTNIRG